MPIRTVAEIAEALRAAKERGKPATLLVGAGCSVTAGIPLADELVSQIAKQFPLAYSRAASPTYGQCMDELSPDERRSLISSHVANASINWEHICIAILLKNGYAGRVLTTNFDPLIVRACALIGYIPAVYDAAVSKVFRSDALPLSSVIYLNGQIDSFVQLNTQAEFNQHSEHHLPIIQSSNQGSPWLILGYSGTNDPTFASLSAMADFPGGLYWLARPDATSSTSAPKLQPALAEVVAEFLGRGPSKHVVIEPSAEDFLVRLCQDLKLFPPDFLAKPFSFLLDQLEQLTPFTIPGVSVPTTFVSETKVMIQKAIDEFEKGSALIPPATVGATEVAAPSLSDLQTALMAGRSDEVIATLGHVMVEGESDRRQLLFLAYLDKGVNLATSAMSRMGASDDPDLVGAEAAFRAALSLYPKHPAALNDLANVLVQRANALPLAQSRSLWAESDALYERALAEVPGDVDTIVNWANGIAAHASREQHPERGVLFDKARQLYESIIATAPDNPRAHAGLAELCRHVARDGDIELSLKMLDLAIDEFGQAVALGGATSEVLNNWGTALQQRAYIGPYAERIQKLQEAAERFRESVKRSPDHASSWINLGLFQLDIIRSSLGIDQKSLTEAEQAYRHALSLPANPEHGHAKVLADLVVLYVSAAEKLPTKADVLLAKAQTALDGASPLITNPEERADYLLGRGYLAHARGAMATDDAARDKLYLEAESLLTEGLENDPSNPQLRAIRGSVRLKRAKLHKSIIQLFDAAIEDFRFYSALKPNDLVARVNLSGALAEKAEVLPIDSEKQRSLRQEIDGLLRPFKGVGSGTPQLLATMGGNLLFLARLEPTNSEQYIREAEQLCIEADTLLPGVAAYNVACAKAILGDKLGARHYLTSAAKYGLPKRSHVASDPDLFSLMSEGWFRDLLAALPE